MSLITLIPEPRYCDPSSITAMTTISAPLLERSWHTVKGVMSTSTPGASCSRLPPHGVWQNNSTTEKMHPHLTYLHTWLLPSLVRVIRCWDKLPAHATDLHRCLARTLPPRTHTKHMHTHTKHTHTHFKCDIWHMYTKHIRTTHTKHTHTRCATLASQQLQRT